MVALTPKRAAFPFREVLLRKRNKKSHVEIMGLRSCGRDHGVEIMARELGKFQLQKRRGIQIDTLPAHGQVQMRAGGAAAAATERDDLMRFDFLAFLYPEF